MEKMSLYLLPLLMLLISCDSEDTASKFSINDSRWGMLSVENKVAYIIREPDESASYVEQNVLILDVQNSNSSRISIRIYQQAVPLRYSYSTDFMPSMPRLQIFWAPYLGDGRHFIGELLIDHWSPGWISGSYEGISRDVDLHENRDESGTFSGPVKMECEYIDHEIDRFITIWVPDPEFSSNFCRDIKNQYL